MDQVVARTLLVELLAHQFCYPVQWIETQDLLLGARNTERIIELGPGNTLVNMAKRTIGLKYQTKDTAQNLSRQLLTFQQNLDKISYEQKFVLPPEIPRSLAVNPDTEPVKTMEVTAPSPEGPIVPTTTTLLANTAPTAEVEDAPVNVVDVVSTIIAVGLKKPLDGFQMSKSIKALAGGRSTLQNEIIGDLASEFDTIPEGAEDLPLDTLCATIQSTFSGKLGKKSSSLIDKMISNKSPGTFQSAGIRKYLKQRWGFGPGRQDSVLLWAVTSAPDFRLKNEDEAKIFLDSVAQIYIAKNGLTPPDASREGASAAGQATISAEALEFLEAKQKTVLMEQLTLSARLLGLDLQASDAAVAGLQQRITVLEKQLDLWNTEHGEVYALGIEPIFSSLKARHYDSWWNWGLQDLLTLVSSVRNQELKRKDPEYEVLRRSLQNRSHPRLLEALRFLASNAVDHELRDILEQLQNDCEATMKRKPAAYPRSVSMAPVTEIEESGKIVYKEQPRPSDAEDGRTHLQLGRKGLRCWEYDPSLSSRLHECLSDAQSSGLAFADNTVLVTGAGAGSIGAEIVRFLLCAGAHVIVTSSSYSSKVTKYYQDVYSKYGARGSKLVLLPCNQASVQDMEALVKYIYEKDGLASDLDFVIPFAAISESGRELDNLNSKSELAHRLMLTNTLRLLGLIKQQKASRGIMTRPAHVVLPLSPNHGMFGGDGLYAESKLGLESLFEKWHTEDWGEYLTICGAIIGWTRGTALMSDNDIVAEGMEKLGMRTYSQEEMAFNILALMSPKILPFAVSGPLVADLSGGMGDVANLKDITTNIRTSINQTSDERRGRAREAEFDALPTNLEPQMERQANMEFNFPTLPDWESQVQPLTEQLEGMVDLSRVVVVTGFAEVGPWGNARVRWDMEANGRLSTESCIELAWIMGLIKAYSGMVDGQPYSGWLDKESGKPITDQGIADKYGKYMLDHAGIRFMEPKKDSPLWNGRDSLQEIEILKDHGPFEVSEECALDLKRAHGDLVHLSPNSESGQVKVTLKKGARIMIPKLLSTQHTVGGQVPTGWDARTYGVPEEIINQVDPGTLYPLVCAAEALRTAGILDPYELYQYLHIADVANCVGSGFGGASSLRKMFKGRYQDGAVPNDVLAESFINSGSAWINMLLLSAAGANKTPVGACATSVESLDTGYDLIVNGKAKACLVGGFDDMLKDVADEFASLKATINVDEDILRGREPKEMSRPATSSRKGFVEAEGAGIQLITSASLAIEMGLPIHGVVAFTNTAMDKAGRSLPAPGRGILGSAVQRQSKYESPLMSMSYRKRALKARLDQAKKLRELQLSYLEEELGQFQSQKVDFDLDEYREQRLAGIDADTRRDERDALNTYGNQFWVHDKTIAPMRGALAVWGLTVDDIDVISFHGTSTRANEKNEASVVHEQLRHLGRKKGNVVPCVFQKSVTGHPKGPAGAWMLNGCLQMMETGVVPGNRNADNIEDALEQFDFLVYPNKSTKKQEIRAFSMTSFGFGQKGAQMVGIHPKYLYATISKQDYQAYERRLRIREKKATRRFHEGLSNNSVFVAKEQPPYAACDEMKVLLNPDTRLPRGS
ncbi:fatty acid synthase subunit alpha reductase [Exophiala viscosa]|uniref:Fatty acid synthase subunit alpha reductase n=1 Tax=Exophiala viscosa TaxID=2486360 RepID=A0AAN6IFB2_9EURO|nr:fatty acid synthase subunit alpha reductase [Exophiala viscosa]